MDNIDSEVRAGIVRLLYKGHNSSYFQKELWRSILDTHRGICVETGMTWTEWPIDQLYYRWDVCMCYLERYWKWLAKPGGITVSPGYEWYSAIINIWLEKKYAVNNVKYPVKDTLPIKYLNLNYVPSKQIGSAVICYDWASCCLLLLFF